METKDKRILKNGALIMGLMYVLPIILANRYYNDDVPEVLYRAPVWCMDGRPLTDLIMRLLCGAHNYIYDIFPLTLILSVVVIMLVSVAWTKKFYDTDGYIGIIVTFLPLSMAFFLSNLSYRFDCISYAMAIAFVMIPFLVEVKDTWKKYVLNIACILISMCFYQAIVGLYIGLTVVVVFLKCFGDEKPFKDVAMRAISTVAAALVYKLVIASVFVDSEGWRGDASDIGTVSYVPVRMASNIYKIVMIIWMHLKGLGARQLLVYLIVFSAGAIAAYCLLEGRLVRYRILVALFYCTLFPVVFLVSVLPVSALDYQSDSPQHLPQLISLMFVLAVSLVLIHRKWPKAALIMGALIVLFRFSFACAYGNTLRQQKEYADYVAQSIVRDIESLDNGDIEEIVIAGEVPYSPVAERLFDSIPVLRRMVPAGLDSDGMFNGALINHYYPHPLDFVSWDEEVRSYFDSPRTPVMNNLVYDLYLENNRVYVRFRDES